MYDVIIIGAGPAGLSCAIYCKRAGLNVCILDKYLLGGNPLNYLEIENYLGAGKIQTTDLVDNYVKHIEEFDIPTFPFEEVIEVDLNNKIVKTTEQTLQAKYIVIATGSRPRMLNVKGEETFIGRGVHYCAICDGPLYTGKKLAVIGGGNSACEEALGLAKICENVHIIEFTDKLNAEQVTVNKIYNTSNISVSLSTKVEEIIGEDKVTGIIINDGEKSKLDFDAVFPYIGMTANSDLFDVEKDHGFIITDENMRTSVDGIYAIGDVRSKAYRQVVTAVSDGAIAAIHISKNL